MAEYDGQMSAFKNIPKGETYEIVDAAARDNIANLATVATTGSYADLSNTPTIPTALSDLTNDEGFIDNTVNNLTNYYLKSETYTQAEVNSLIGSVAGLNIEVVVSLPTQDISTSTIYLVPKSTAQTDNVYDEYINTDGTSAGWELIGDTSVDLSNYYTKTEADNLLSDKVDKVTGKGLSEEDFTTTLKTKLDSINAGAEVNVQSNWTEADTTSDAYIQNKPSLATVATSGSYNDLTNKPTIPSAQVNSDWNSNSGVSQILNKPSLATVATSGSYNDLSNKPTIPSAQVNSDWNASSGVAQILNKPSLATVATSGDYDDLTNKPTIPTDTWRPLYAENVLGQTVLLSNSAMNFSNSGNVKFTSLDTQSQIALYASVDLSSKQDKLVSGSNIKTVNGNSILGSGDVATASNISSYALPVQTGTDWNTWTTIGGEKCVACPQNSWKSIGSVEFPVGIWLFKAYVYFYTNANGYRGLCISETANTGTIDMLVPAVSGIQTGLSTSKIIQVTSGTKRYFITVLHNAGGDLYTFPHFDAVKLSS